MAEYELTPQIRAVLVSILRRAARRGRELREQRAAASEAGNESAASDASVSQWKAREEWVDRLVAITD